MDAFPDGIRLSIHASLDPRKLPISLFPGKNSFTTPWHAACAVNIDGSMKFASRAVLSNDPKYEIVHKDGRLSHFQEISDLYSWNDIEIDITPIYPCGVVISPRTPNSVPLPSIQAADMLKVRALAELQSPVILRGFSMSEHAVTGEATTDREIFAGKAREMGSIMPWKFGEILVVKDGGAETGGLNNVLSAEPMPFHFDGLFKTALIVGKDGVERLVPQPPRSVIPLICFHSMRFLGTQNLTASLTFSPRCRFQMFTARTPSPHDTGFTLITSSRLLFENLPSSYTVELLKDFTWNVQTTSFNSTKLTDLALVIPHPNPAIDTPCLRYHEPWGRDKTKFDPTVVGLSGPWLEKVGDEDKVLAMIDELLYDRRNCYYHSWEKGDWLVNDNISMMHTRSGFSSGAERELWRIHVD
jgi:hypothetical protein